MCHESSGWALLETIGAGKGTVTLEDFDLAQAIFVIGQNPGTNHPRMLTALERAKRNGCKLVHINPLPEAGMTNFKHPQEVLRWLGGGTDLADLFLQVRINGDVALLKGIMKAVLPANAPARNVLDLELYQNTVRIIGVCFPNALGEVDGSALVKQCGIQRDKLKQPVKSSFSRTPASFAAAMGLDSAQERRGHYSRV